MSEAIVTTNGWDQLPGWCDFEDLYEDAMREAPNFATFVEVGVGFGRSLALLASLGEKHFKRPVIYGVDPCVDDWNSDKPTWGANHRPWALEQGGPFNALVGNMSRVCPALLERVNILRCRSVQAARLFDVKSLQFVFIDGSHHFIDVLEDIYMWMDKVRPGGVLAGHDFNDDFPGVQQAVAKALGNVTVEKRGNCWWHRVPA